MSSAASIQAVIFDMDGVLADSEPIYHLSINQVLASHGHQLSHEANKAILGTTVEYTWRWIIEHLNLKGSMESWIARYDAAVVKNLKEQVVPSPGVYELLEDMRDRGLSLGLASSSQENWVEAVLAALGIQGQFDVVVSGEMVTKGKPDPEIFLLTAKRLAVEPARCLVIEDSPHGIRAAKRAGMVVVALRTPLTEDLDLSQADRLIDSLTQFDYKLLG
ncbi:MAG: HAD family hydrolase [Dehalococcoidia bacterium]